MNPILSKDQPALLLGVADFIQPSRAPFPFGPIDIFQLSQHKAHIIYPGMIQSLVWVVLMRVELFKENGLPHWTLRIADADEAELGRIVFDGLSNADTDEGQPHDGFQISNRALS